MNQHNTPRNLRLLSVVALSGALMVSGCTDDSEEANKDDTSTASGATAEDAGVTGACDAYTDITLAMAEAPDGDPTAWFTDTIKLMADDLDAADKPADIEGDLDTMIGTVRQVAQTGDPSAFEEPKFGEAQTKVDRYMFDNCEFDQKLEVSGKDYSFEGLSDELPPGRTAIMFTNDGMEAHEIVVASKKDGVTESFGELLEMPEEEAMAKINMLGGAMAPHEGDQAIMIADFEPGDYAALCFIPTGSTMANSDEPDGDGPPHFTQGMKTEFTVK